MRFFLRLLVLSSLLVLGCELLDWEAECPVNCTTKVTDPNGHVVECHCPNN